MTPHSDSMANAPQAGGRSRCRRPERQVLVDQERREREFPDPLRTRFVARLLSVRFGRASRINTSAGI
jgi:hypothetical protein